MRKLLILTSRPLDTGVEEALQLAGWMIHYAGSARQPQDIILREGPLVGLILVWPEDAQAQSQRYAKAISSFPRLKWVAAFGRGRMDDNTCIAMAAEHLFDFLSLPLDIQRLIVILGHAYGMAQVDNRFLELQERERVGRFGMVGTSSPMQSLYQDIERAAACELPVVVSGETGSGKEMAARSIHANSVYSAGPFVAVSSLTMPRPILQTRRGGSGIGVSADAFDPESGPIVVADGSTLFLDGVAEMPLQAQASLVRFLDLQFANRRDRNGPTPAVVRVIASADVDLEERVKEQRFRPDLYYRLQNLSIKVPSLRERGDDVHALALHFLDELRQHHRSKAQGFHPAAQQIIAAYHWPGNLRELRNRVQQAGLRSRTPLITPADLGLAQSEWGGTPVTLQEARGAAEIRAITTAIRRNNYSMTRAAEELQVSRMTLYRLLQKHAIQDLG